MAVSEQEREQILDLFGSTADVSIIDEILYFEGWSGYEDHAGYLIFRGIDGSIQFDEYAYCAAACDYSVAIFTPREITQEEMTDYIIEMRRLQDGVFD